MDDMINSTLQEYVYLQGGNFMNYNEMVAQSCNNQTVERDSLQGFENFTDLILEDGTRAMIVNGTLVTPDGQTIILQDEENLSQYYIEEDAEAIIILKEQKRLLNTLTAEDSENDVIEPYKNNVEELYLEDTITQSTQSHNTNVDSSSIETTTSVNQEGKDVTENIVEIDDLLTIGDQKIFQIDGQSYQFAILKDGKLHLQMSNPEEQTSSVNPLLKVDKVGLSLKSQQGGEKSLHNLIEEKHIKSQNKGRIDISYIKGKEKRSCLNNVYLNRLVNKKLKLGRTENGKILVGKIVNVMQKTENQSKRIPKKLNPRTTSFQRKTSLLKEKIQGTGATGEQVLTVNYQKSNDQKINNDETNYGKHLNNAFPLDMTQQSHAISTQKNITNRNYSDNDQETATTITASVPITKDRSDFKRVADTNRIDIMPSDSKVIIHKKVVNKNCFDVIAKTLSGLMNMDSVVKKLRNRTIILKVDENKYDKDTNEYKRNISYCSGYMVQEYELNDKEDNITEDWKFIPDINSTEIILEKTLPQENLAREEGQNNPKKITNLTIQVTTHPEGNRTTKVIINPSKMYKCVCQKSFKTNRSLKLHSTICKTKKQQQPVSINYFCETCSIQFSNKQQQELHLQIHSVQNSKNEEFGSNAGMYECVECNKRFVSSLQLRKHMEIHFKEVRCRYCTESFSNLWLLKSHLSIHKESVPLNFEPNSAVYRETIDPISPSRNLKKVRMFYCEICGKQFSKHSNLLRHTDIHKGEGALYKCAICSCSYHYVSSLTRHVVSCHINTSKSRFSNTKLIECQESNKQEQIVTEETEVLEVVPLEVVRSEDNYKNNQVFSNCFQSIDKLKFSTI